MITLKYLAQKLDVSVSTVSKALNDSPEISQITIDRIKALAEYYNYQPNKVALSLKNSQTKTIGVIVPNILNRFFARVLFGIQDEATKFGYNIIICSSNESTEKEKACLDLLGNGSVDGFILAASEETQLSFNSTHFKSVQESGSPIVMFDRVLDNIECDKIIIDDFATAELATIKLIEKGRRNIAFVSTIDNLNVGKLRSNGFKNAILENLGSLNESLILKIDMNYNIQDQIKTFLVNNSNIDGAIASDNMSGTVLVNVASSLGRSIPNDISVIGFADEEISNLSVPKLATINQNAEEMGKASVNLLLDRLSKKEALPNTFVTKIIETSITERSSF